MYKKRTRTNNTNTNYVQLAQTTSSTLESNEVMAEEDFLQKYLVDSMISAATEYFSPVTHLIKNIVDGTNYTQSDTFSFPDPPSMVPELFNVTTGSDRHLKTKFWDIFRKARVTAMEALIASNNNNTTYTAKDYKNIWLENPSSVINSCSSISKTPVRTISASATTSQLSAVNSLTKFGEEDEYTDLIPISTTTTTARKKVLEKKYPNRMKQQQIRCCICGLGEPPELTDIEHVVSSQLLIWLGINPGIISAKEFGKTDADDDDDGDGDDDIVSVASDLAFGKISNKQKLKNWIETISIKLNDGKKQSHYVNNIIRSMFRPAHIHCNRYIKSEYSPFTTDASGQIISNLETPIKIKTEQSTYKDGVIIKSIKETIKKFEPPKPTSLQIKTHTQKWIEIQKEEFNQIAFFLNAIDNQTKISSFNLLDKMATLIFNKNNPKELSAFRDFILSLLGSNSEDKGSDIDSIATLKDDNKEELAENLALINKIILSRFMYCVHKIDNDSGAASGVKSGNNSPSVSVFSPTQSVLGSSEWGSGERGSQFTGDSARPVRVSNVGSPIKLDYGGGRKTKKRIRKTKKRKMNKKSKTRRRK